MTKRRLVWAALVTCAALLVCAAVSRYLAEPSRITQKDTDKVRLGMTHAQVHAALRLSSSEGRTTFWPSGGVSWEVWEFGRGWEFHVGYDRNGVVGDCALIDERPQNLSTRLHDWLGW